MRQAGRYLPEYRAIREDVSFEELCRSPDLACEVTMQPIRRYDFDAAIIFSDILVVSDALGCEFHFPKGGPVTNSPVRSQADIDALTVSDPRESLGFVMEALKRTRAALPAHTALIGFAGAPLTVANYMVEGAASKTNALIKSMIFHEPKLAHALLSKLARMTAEYLKAQIEAGANAVQLFDTWAAIVPDSVYAEVVLPHVKFIFDALKDCGVPRIYFAKASSHLFPWIREIDAEVFGVDWTLSLDRARGLLDLGAQKPVQGNLDPIHLLGQPEQVRASVRSVLDSISDKRGYIFNLGHGIQKQTPPENVSALVEEVRAFKLGVKH